MQPPWKASLNRTDVGLGNVDNTSDTAKPVSTAQQTALNGKQSTSERNAVNGYAGLDSAGLVPATLLPSYVDDVVEYAAIGNFPATGEAGKIYVATGTGKIYRWSGSAYVEISPSPGSTDSVPEGSTNLYFTQSRADARAAAALTARSVLAGTGLTGGGTLAADRTLAVTYGTTSGTAAQGNDSRLGLASTAVQPADLAAAQLVTVNAQTAAYTLAVADAGKAVEVTASAGVTVTVPANSTAAIPVGAIIEIVQCGAGQVTVAAASGVTINTAGSMVTRAQWSVIALRKRSTDVWVLAGDAQ